jgi:hypothetical protein
VSERGRSALAALPADLPLKNATRLATLLRRSFPPPEAAALAEQLTLRARAERNHGGHRGLLYTAEGLEMMTHPLVAERRARRLAADSRVIDLTAGIGGDLRAIAREAVDCAGLDLDPAHALLAAANSGAQVARGDAARAPFDPSRSAVLIDPSRRADETRRFRPSAFSPAWDQALALAESATTAAIKAPPGVGAEYIPPQAEVEAVQLATSMREVTLWFGEGATPGLRRAVLLPSGATLDSTEPESPAAPGPAGSFVFDPESCVTRATLVTHLGHRLRAWLLDPHIAYLSANQPAFSPLAATFEVIEAVPFSVSRLRERLRALGLRPDEIRRRAFPVEPDELRKLLGRLAGERVTLLCTTTGGQRTVFLCRRLFAPA